MLTDLYYVLRSLARARGFSAVVILTLALGIGSATAIFSVVHAWSFFRAASFPDGLVVLGQDSRESRFTPISYSAQAAAYRELTDVIAETALSKNDQVNVVVNGEPVASSVVSVSPNFLSLVGANPFHGRGFLPGEDVDGHNDVVVIRDEFRREVFPDVADVIGRKIVVDEKVCTVIGVLAPRQALPPLANGTLFRPSAFRVESGSAWRSWLVVFARLRPGISPQVAQEAMAAAQKEAPPPEMKAFVAERRPHVATMREVLDIMGGKTQAVFVGAVGFLYAIACLNASNLMLVRLLGRRREFSIRLALGAGRSRLLRLLVLEGLVLALAAGVVGVLVANWLVPLLLALARSPGDFSWSRWSLDRLTLYVLVALTFVTALAVMLIPAVRLARARVQEGLKEGGTALGETRGLARLRSAFVVLQAGIALVLLTGAGLMVRTVEKLEAVPLGFETRQRMKATLSFPAGHVAGKDERHELLQQLQQRLSRVPGVVGVSYGTDTLLAGYFYGGVTLTPPHGEPIKVNVDYVSQNFLKVSGMRLEAGRMIGENGAEFLINDALAEKYFGDQDPIGRTLHKEADRGSGAGDWLVVGLVNDVRYNLREAPGYHIYAPESWWPPSINSFIFQVSREPDKLMGAAIKRAIYELDPKVVVNAVASFDEIRGWNAYMENYMSAVLKVLSGFALTLATVGMFSVLAYAVDQRRGEFGVRLALGATSRNLIGLVMRRGVTLAITGVVLGIAGSFILAQYVQSLLYQTPPHDPVVLASVSILLLTAAVLACVLPARRAGKVDVAKLLRSE